MKNLQLVQYGKNLSKSILMNLDSNRTEVFQFIKNNIHLENIIILDQVPYMPGAIIVTDINNDKLMFYFDIERYQVKWQNM